METPAPQYVKIDAEGNFKGAIKEIYPIRHRFSHADPKPLEIKIVAITEDYKFAEIYLDMSTDYMRNQKGTPKRYIDGAMEQLAAFGIGNDLTKLPTLVGAPISFYAKLDKKEGKYLNFYISRYEEEKVDVNDATALLATMLAGNTSAGEDQGAFGGGDAFGSGETEDKLPF